MAIQSDVSLPGRVRFSVFDADEIVRLRLLDERSIVQAVRSGLLRPKRVQHDNNTVTNYALNYMAQIYTNTAQYPLVLPNQMELGTGSGTPARTDTDLWSPALATLKPVSQMEVYLSYYAQFITAWMTTDPIDGTWTEIGLKDANGNLWAHAASTITINSGEQLIAQWAVQMTPG